MTYLSDTHHSDKADAPIDPSVVGVGVMWRPKVEHFSTSMNAQKVAFVVGLGDFIDNPRFMATMGVTAGTQASFEFLEKIETLYAHFDGPRYHVFGNHGTFSERR